MGLGETQCGRCGAWLIAEAGRASSINAIRPASDSEVPAGYVPVFHLCYDCLRQNPKAIRSDVWGWLVPMK